jgi:biopolymer transport protein ExbB
MRSWGVLACALGSVIAGCGADAFSCTDHSMCDRSPGGRCEISGYCSFPDAACASGFRFGEHAPAGLAMRCTEAEGDSEVDPTVADAGSSAGAEADASTRDAGDDDPSTSGGSGGPIGCAGWWDCEWAFRREIVVSGDVGETLEHFPVPLTLDDVSDTTRFGPDGLDVRVVGEDGRMLPFEIETWAPDAPAVIWVALPRIEPDVGARAWLYYGNPSAPPEDSGAAVWDAAFAGVWHLSTTDDATANGNHAEDQGSVSAAGMIGAARTFDTAGQRLVVPGSDSLADLPVDGVTITTWMLPVTPGFVSGGRIIDNADGTAALTGFSLLTSPTALGLEWNRGAQTSEGSWIDNDTLPYGRWQHVALTFADGGEPSCRIDGVPVAFEDVTLPVGGIGTDAGAPFGIGGAPYDDTHTFDGTLDELRVSRGLRSDAWILAEFQSATGRLVALGPEEEAPS